MSPSQLTFFGLTPEHRLSMYTIIHEIVFHGKGGYTWDTIYNMPIWLRRFTFEKIKEYYDKEREEAEKQQKKLTNKSGKEIAKPNIPDNPTYSTRATKK
jgi:thioredoxin-related protein